MPMKEQETNPSNREDSVQLNLVLCIPGERYAKKTGYCCPVCDEKPALYVKNCFTEYHNTLIFTRYIVILERPLILLYPKVE